jgi:hypothetical protein
MKKITNIILILVFATSCKQEPKDKTAQFKDENIKTACEYVSAKNSIYKEMISLKEGKDLNFLNKNPDSKNSKKFTDLFILHNTLVEKANKRFNLSSCESCPEEKEMQENMKKAFDQEPINKLTKIMFEKIKTPCDYVSLRNIMCKNMISLKKGKDLNALMKNEDSDFFTLFSLHDQLVYEANKRFKLSSCELCPEWKEMEENCRKAFE